MEVVENGVTKIRKHWIDEDGVDCSEYLVINKVSDSYVLYKHLFHNRLIYMYLDVLSRERICGYAGFRQEPQ